MTILTEKNIAKLENVMNQTAEMMRKCTFWKRGENQGELKKIIEERVDQMFTEMGIEKEEIKNWLLENTKIYVVKSFPKLKLTRKDSPNPLEELETCGYERFVKYHTEHVNEIFRRATIGTKREYGQNSEQALVSIMKAHYDVKVESYDESALYYAGFYLMDEAQLSQYLLKNGDKVSEQAKDREYLCVEVPDGTNFSYDCHNDAKTGWDIVLGREMSCREYLDTFDFRAKVEQAVDASERKAVNTENRNADKTENIPMPETDASISMAM